MHDTLTKFLDIYTKLANLHVVPKWYWNKNSILKLDQILKKCELPYYLDEVGNVILNVTSSAELIDGINSETIAQIFQAHLDHPGGVVKGVLGKNENLYCARWLGGYANSLEGRRILVYDVDSNLSEITKVEYEVFDSSGRLIYFYCDKKFQPESSVVHYVDENKSDDSSGIHGWALDDMIGCTSVIQTLSENRDSSCVGLLTLGEEIGCYGLKYFCNTYLKPGSSKPPYFINIDMPEEEDNRFLSGNGAWLRVADRRSKYSKELIGAIKSHLPHLKTISLTKGGTEAGNLVSMGFKAVSFAIPLKNLHNGSKHNCWAKESVLKSDVNALLKSLSSVVSMPQLVDARRPVKISNKANFKIKHVNYAKKITTKIKVSKEYCDYLANVSGYWNEINSKHDLPVRTLSSEEYDDLKKNLSSNKYDDWDKKIVNLATEIFPIIADRLAQNYTHSFATLNILSFIKSNFNACNMNGDIGLSFDRLEEDDLKRVLAHEITHWVCGRIYGPNPYDDFIGLLISEGVACYVSRELCKIDSPQALGVPDKTYLHYETIDRKLKNIFLDIVQGHIISEEKLVKHTTLKQNEYSHPFRLYKGNPFNKYGYYLGLKFVDYCVERKLEIGDLFSKFKFTENMFKEFIAD